VPQCVLIICPTDSYATAELTALIREQAAKQGHEEKEALYSREQ
jgi:hypothetical protein